MHRSQEPSAVYSFLLGLASDAVSSQIPLSWILNSLTSVLPWGSQ